MTRRTRGMYFIIVTFAALPGPPRQPHQHQPGGATAGAIRLLLFGGLLDRASRLFFS